MCVCVCVCVCVCDKDSGVIAGRRGKEWGVGLGGLEVKGFHCNICIARGSQGTELHNHILRQR